MSDDQHDDNRDPKFLTDPAVIEAAEKAIDAALDRLFENVYELIRLSLESNIPLFLNQPANEALANAAIVRTKTRFVRAIAKAVQEVNVRLEDERDDALNRWEELRQKLAEQDDDPDPDLDLTNGEDSDYR